MRTEGELGKREEAPDLRGGGGFKRKEKIKTLP